MSIKRLQVGRISSVDGKFFSYTRDYSFGTQTHQGVEGTPVFLNDIIETDENTTVEIQYYIGGRDNVFPSHKVKIIGQRESKILAFDKISAFKSLFEDKPLKIKSAGGVIGDRG